MNSQRCHRWLCRATMTVVATLALRLALPGCGDNILLEGQSLQPVARVNIVAHPDDDLLFMQPDLWTALAHGEGVLTVYVTAGQAKKDLHYAEDRQQAVMYAYQVASGATAWSCGTITLANHLAEHCQAQGTAAPVSLVFLGLPDGGPKGNFHGSLLSLWSGQVASVKTIARRPQRYTQDDVIAVLAEVLRQTQPIHVNTLDVVATHGLDHSDHLLVGAAAVRAVATAKLAAPIVAFRGYNVLSEPINKPDIMYDAVSVMMRGYGACTESCGSCGSQVCSSISEYHEGLLRRRYATSMRQRTGRAQVYHAGLCLDVSGTALRLSDCASAPVWQVHNDQLELAGQCVTASADGSLAIASCDGSAGQWWRFSDDGPLLGGIAPPHVKDMLLRHTLCMAATVDAEGAQVRGEACGDAVAPNWELRSSWQATVLSTVPPLAVTLGDMSGDAKADLCELRSDGVYCGVGDGHGNFASLQRADGIGRPAQPWQDPGFVVGVDVNGGVACTTHDRELRCLPLGAGARAGWEKTMPAPIAARSLALLDVNADRQLEVCVNHDTQQCFDLRGELVLTRSADATEQLVDIDHDGTLDSCGIAGGQLQCAITADVPWHNATIVWSYANRGAWETVAAPMPTATIVWADLDGDAVPDACVAAAGGRCAFGNRYGLGPSFAIAGPIANPLRLWLVDIDGTGAREPCMADATHVYCPGW